MYAKHRIDSRRQTVLEVAEELIRRHGPGAQKEAQRRETAASQLSAGFYSRVRSTAARLTVERAEWVWKQVIIKAHSSGCHWIKVTKLNGQIEHRFTGGKYGPHTVFGDDPWRAAIHWDGYLAATLKRTTSC